jgi:hypothetical protein
MGNSIGPLRYTVGVHNVYEVTKATYQSCDASTGVLAKYESGDDTVKLSKARPYWFLCNIEGHCLGGMRFGINVANATTAAFSPSQTGNNATYPPPPSSPSQMGNNATPPPPSGSKAIRGGTIDATCVLIFTVIIKILL